MNDYDCPLGGGQGHMIFMYGDGYFRDTSSSLYYTGYREGNGKGYVKFYKQGSGDANCSIHFDFNIIYVL